MIAERIKQLRLVLELSQTDFGKQLGVSRDVISNLEQKRSEPKEVFTDHICHIFGVSKLWLISGEGVIFEHEPKEDKQLNEAVKIFTSLCPKYRDYALNQMMSLLAMQSDDDNNPPSVK